MSRGVMANGQVYYRSEKRHGMPRTHARRPSKKQVRKWRRTLRRLGVSAEEYQRMLSCRAWYRFSVLGRGMP